MTEKLTDKEYLTLAKFATKHGISGKEKKDILLRAADKLSRIYITNPAGNRVQTVFKTRKSHNGVSGIRIPPYSEQVVLKKYNEDWAAHVAKAKGAEK